MVCSFCHHEFDEALTECPYCHRIVEKDAHSLTVEERESFDGATIEVDGTVCGGEGDRARSGEYQERFDDGPRDGRTIREKTTARDCGFTRSTPGASCSGSFWLSWPCCLSFHPAGLFVLALVAAAGFFLYRLLSGF